MSQQFVFWSTAKRQDPLKVYGRLMRGKTVRGLDPVDPARAEAELMAEFADWTVDAHRAPGREQTMLASPDGTGAFDIGYTGQSVTVTCYGTGPGEWNRVIDAMHRLDLPLYDPQINERFPLP